MFLKKKKKLIKIEGIDTDQYDKYVKLIVEACILLKEYKFDEILIGSLDLYFVQSITYTNGSISIESTNLNIYNQSGLMKIFTDSCGYSNLYAIAVYTKDCSVYIRTDNPTLSAMNLSLNYAEYIYYVYHYSWICANKIWKDSDPYFKFLKIRSDYFLNKNKLPYRLYMDIRRNKFGEFSIDEPNESRKNRKFIHSLDIYGFAGDVIFEVLKFKGVYSIDDIVQDMQCMFAYNRKLHGHDSKSISLKTLAAMHNKFCVIQDGDIIYNEDTNKTYVIKNDEAVEIESTLSR